MADKEYNEDGYLIVSELYCCHLWEKDTIPCMADWKKDCFSCRFSDFRTPQFIERVEGMQRTEMFKSICRNEQNRK